MDDLPIKSPGIYINEINAFPNSVVSVETAVPAFIGYTPQAQYEGKSYAFVPQKINSFAEFQAIYCFPDQANPSYPTKQYNPEYYLIQQKGEPEKGNYMLIDEIYYSIVPDPNTIYYLYNSIRLFYDNGGQDAYIVSVGSYGAPSGSPMEPGDQIINPNVSLDDLLNGIAQLKNEVEPTMYLCPEATLLSVGNNGTLMQAMLLQNTEMKTAISIFDVIGGRNPDPILFTKDIEIFRNNTGSWGLDYGTVYYPFIGTSVMQNSDIDFTNLFGGNIKELEPLINPPDNPNQRVEAVLANINNPQSGMTVAQNNNALRNVSKTYGRILNHVIADANVLPASGAMAGVITRVDLEQGVWQAPANTSIVGATSLPIRLSDSQQADLNVDAVSGKSINAIRYFNGMGILIWGARTLDGNSLDWRYLPVRRTIIFLEQSCKAAISSYVFEPNVKNTWESVKVLIKNFLTSVWKAGGLQAAVPTDAFSVECGLGSTMTSEDVLSGIMRISVKVAIVRPAEFIILTFEQQMAQSG